MKKEMFFNLSQVKPEIEKIYNEGITRGLYMGFEQLHELFSFKEIGTTYIYGAPFCLGKGTKVIMYDGSLKNVEDVILGDLLMGDDSTPRAVLKTCHGIDNLFLVKQNRGIDYVVNSNHVLSLMACKTIPRSQQRIKGRIIDVPVIKYKDSSNTFKRTFKGYKAPISFKEQPLIIEPYFLGLWLGDGRSAGVDITTIEPEIKQYIQDYAERLGLKFSEYKGKDKTSSFAITGKKVGNKYTGLQNVLRGMGLINNKHIPFEFIKNSRENRLQLLAGLIDTDGCKSKGSHFTFCQKSEFLIKQVKYLCDTLGFRTSITSMIKKCQTGASGVYFNLSIGGNIQDIPVRVNKKKINDYTPHHACTEITIKPHGIGEYYGFTIDGNHRFLLEDGTVTHNSGKTEWWLETLVYFSENYGWHHAIYTPESGNAAEIFAELLSKYLQKPFYKNIKGHMTEVERLKAEDFIREYFYVIDPADKEVSIKDFYKIVSEIEKKHEIKINTTCCDPFNELDHAEMSEHGRQDLYIENMLGFIRKDAFTNSRHNVIITHCTDQKQVKAQGTEKYFYPPPSPREIAGGQAWYRKAMNLICLWRPPFGDGWNNPNGEPYKENEVHIIINKYKPKGVGKRGAIQLFFNSHRNRYFEILNNQERFAGKQERPAQQELEQTYAF